MEEIRINFTKLYKIVEHVVSILSVLCNATIVIALHFVATDKIYSIALFVVAFLLLSLVAFLDEALIKVKVTKKDFYNALKKETTKEDNIYAISNWNSYSSIG